MFTTLNGIDRMFSGGLPQPRHPSVVNPPEFAHLSLVRLKSPTGGNGCKYSRRSLSSKRQPSEPSLDARNCGGQTDRPRLRIVQLHEVGQTGASSRSYVLAEVETTYAP